MSAIEIAATQARVSGMRSLAAGLLEIESRISALEAANSDVKHQMAQTEICQYADCGWCYHPDVGKPYECLGLHKVGCPLLSPFRKAETTDPARCTTSDRSKVDCHNCQHDATTLPHRPHKAQYSGPYPTAEKVPFDPGEAAKGDSCGLVEVMSRVIAHCLEGEETWEDWQPEARAAIEAVAEWLDETGYWSQYEADRCARVSDALRSQLCETPDTCEDVPRIADKPNDGTAVVQDGSAQNVLVCADENGIAELKAELAKRTEALNACSQVANALYPADPVTAADAWSMLWRALNQVSDSWPICPDLPTRTKHSDFLSRTEPDTNGALADTKEPNLAQHRARPHVPQGSTTEGEV